KNSSEPGSFSVQYMYMFSDRESGTWISNYALDHLRHKLDFRVRYPVASLGGITLTASWQHRNGEYLYYDRTEDAYTEVRPFVSFWMVNGRVFHQRDTARFFIELSNILDVTYQDIANVPQPGRWMKTGVSFTFR
ncbi:hypothetical protein QLX67_04735, partial [Balneolaceae bacterium ANBcel3]|nr:hypothetical protein [Balneolaceae bacterium ANBcel3]